jgi:hypothetical protein
LTCRFFSNEQGSALVEAALLLPILVLIVFTGLDILRTIQLMHRVDLVTESLGASLATRDEVDEQDIADLVPQVQASLGYYKRDVRIMIRVSSITLDPLNGAGEYWSAEVGETSVSCDQHGTFPSYTAIDGEEVYWPHQDFLVIRTCISPVEDFYLSSYRAHSQKNYASISRHSGTPAFKHGV